MLSYRRVYKTYGYLSVINGVTIDFEPGVIHALLGPNGSGKSTLLRMAVGLTRPDSGRVSVAGVNPVERPEDAKRVVGYAPEEITLYDSLTPRETVELVRWAHGLGPRVETRLEKLLEVFGLTEEADRRVGELSLGARRRLLLVCALVHDPPVLVLDEPFSGLDLEGAVVLREILRKEASRGKTVVFTTHVMPLAEALGDVVIILNLGRVVARGRPEELREAVSASSLEEVLLRETGVDARVRSILRALGAGDELR